MAANAEEEGGHIPITFKYKKETFTQTFHPSCTFLGVKTSIYETTNIHPARVKLLGLKHRETKKKPGDDDLLEELVWKEGKAVMVMGTPEEEVFVDPADLDGEIPEVFDDLDLDFYPEASDSLRLLEDPVIRGRLDEAIAKTDLRMLAQPREGKRLLVLDLDYTLFDHKSIGAGSMDEIKRPFLEEFLAMAYQHYDIVVWSQTKWTWLEMKLTELGLLSHPNFSIMFVLDISSMFTVRSIRKGKERAHQVKALDIIWALFPGVYTAANTIHIDDVSRNFALNPASGLKIKAFKRKYKAKDRELFLLTAYLIHLAEQNLDFRSLDHSRWRSIAKRIIAETKMDDLAPAME